ncbi:Uncharacterised protein [Shigella sonnei]|nr:Uncharacterised protein [Shigella sonnei]
MHRFCLRIITLNARHHAVFVLFQTPRHRQQTARLVNHHNVVILIQDNQPGFLRWIVVFHPHFRLRY